MLFEEALTAMREGKTAARPEWDGYRIKFTRGDTNIVKNLGRGMSNNWFPTSLDIAATDWQVV